MAKSKIKGVSKYWESQWLMFDDSDGWYRSSLNSRFADNYQSCCGRGIVNSFNVFGVKKIKICIASREIDLDYAKQYRTDIPERACEAGESMFTKRLLEAGFLDGERIQWWVEYEEV